MKLHKRFLGLVDLDVSVGENKGLSSIRVNWAKPRQKNDPPAGSDQSDRESRRT
ncbi:hypothetical protein IEU95_05355 [Hoyosella rhizosphaerae]|uniref:Uncharacterized protein n=1 Tax=Hoyosella rhizosphaerae TaxID=1755582 RepID=A0A916XCP8_9ACTN|nr:hypothetical protein [Hoyosella rhizosphaerae]MBN4926246.1 hypothetical protein [Hoyosella rhizosphaerae]GGC60925.1 hypothetical protein GCM10011410_11750 [Hoyosella rhizosphaerae]